MIRFLLRFIGFWLLAGGFVALIVDGTRSIAASGLLLTSAGDAWFAVAPASLEQLQASLQMSAPGLWSRVLAPVLSVPAFALLGGIGMVLLALGQVREHSRFEVS